MDGQGKAEEGLESVVCDNAGSDTGVNTPAVGPLPQAFACDGKRGAREELPISWSPDFHSRLARAFSSPLALAACPTQNEIKTTRRRTRQSIGSHALFLFYVVKVLPAPG